MSERPLIYSCSGCSNLAQLANRAAVELDREQFVEMSCIAGVGGGVSPLVRKATTGRDAGRTIIALDGCPLHCVKQCLAQHDIQPTLHYTLTERGLKKRQHEDYSPADVVKVKAQIVADMDNLD